MANVMLTSETAKDPNKPFKLRVEDVCTKFDVRVKSRLSRVAAGATACAADPVVYCVSRLCSQALVTECLLLVQSEEQIACVTTASGGGHCKEGV